ncbi:hypothetical protein K466DRAFT_149066 [Polyporus arcularius HHB13444]|uniref:Uncharacterized protein n=1 Tax=Polyporus arcularius HHB13444 TaxID=1314778 RepID=A0A5C3PKN3_9APHY|nr:hypothetical protein K466DRAFT_149066 [Polyporus arcularius HHB13444]
MQPLTLSTNSSHAYGSGASDAALRRAVNLKLKLRTPPRSSAGGASATGSGARTTRNQDSMTRPRHLSASPRTSHDNIIERGLDSRHRTSLRSALRPYVVLTTDQLRAGMAHQISDLRPHLSTPPAVRNTVLLSGPGLSVSHLDAVAPRHVDPRPQFRVHRSRSTPRASSVESRVKPAAPTTDSVHTSDGCPIDSNV